jgi:hypothetical protein
MPPAWADPTRLRQILIILLDNAIKFTPSNGAVRVRSRVLERDPNFLILEVSDSGCGISPDMTERIFERLFRVSDSALAGRQGLGLGLYICKELVARQGGQIWATSTPVQGSTLCVTLPIFSLPTLIAPALREEKRADGPFTFVVIEAGSLTGWLSDAARGEHSHKVRDILQRCLHSDLDVILPKMSSEGAAELFFILASTDEIGGEAITKRIRQQLDGCEQISQAGLTFSTSFRPLESSLRTPGESMECFLERFANKIQSVMNEEISSRMVVHG